MAPNKLPKRLINKAGQYFVAGELLRLGYIVSIPLRNNTGGINVSNADGTKQVAIQVRASQGDKPEWVLNDKAETIYADNLFYVFVNLKGPMEWPDFYVVPSKTVADFVKMDHRRWLERPGRKGQPHKDNRVRKFRDPERKFLGRWDLLGL